MKEYKYPAIANYEYYNLFGTPVKQLILKFLYDHSGKQYSVLDLAREVHVPSSSLSKSLSELEEFGLLDREEKGKYVYYQLNKEVAGKFKEIYDNLQKAHAWALQNKRRKK